MPESPPETPVDTTPAATQHARWQRVVALARRARRPLERFLRIEAASGVVLVVAAAIALAWATLSHESYDWVWQTPLRLEVGGASIERPLAWLVNDVLMVIFFFVVGMEIRRELYEGELSEWRRAALPAIAALGGMIAPALLYLSIAGGARTHHGWGVPTATDIAFAVGVLALLGKRVPAALRVLLLALAVIDDLGAIVLIALFYSSGVTLVGLTLAAAGVLTILAMQRLGVRSAIAYVLPAVVVWAGVHMAGVHPTIAGVVVGLMTPVRAWPTPEAPSPAERLIATLHPWVAFGIMPLFALANAGVHVASLPTDRASLTVMGAVAIGLALGKPIGVLGACFLALRLRIASLPAGIGLPQLVVLGAVAGIGFTMSIFVAALAFADPALLAAAKLGVLAGSTTAALVGIALGRMLLPTTQPVRIAESADEAESSTEL